MRLPTPREPLCSMNQTRSASSRHTSMKWLPVPSVPRWFDVVAAARAAGACSTMRFVARLELAPDVARSRSGRRATRRDRRGRRCRCGRAARRARSRRAASRRSSGRSWRVERRLHRHHAAADVDADRRRDDRALRRDDAADRRADAECTSGIAATHWWTNGSRAMLRELLRAPRPRTARRGSTP